jgi:hypothetical protein
VDDACGGDNFIGRVAVEVQRVDARQVSSVSGQVWILDNVRANSESSRSSSMRPNSESFAISQSKIPEILQVSFDNNVLSRGVKSSLRA